MPILMALPLAALAAWRWFWRSLDTPEGPREAWVKAGVTWAALAVFFSELLSAFHALSLWPMAIAWMLATLIPLACVRRRASLGWGKVPWRFAIPIIGLAGAALLVALLVPPMTFDSMTYHLSRVEHWRVNQTISHYPTHIERQIMFGPCAELLILQFQVLGNGADGLANLGQWLAWLGAMAAVSLIVREFGGDVTAQWFAALFTATAPMLILQASSTQNDLVCAFFLAAYIWFGLAWLREPRRERAWFLGLALALAIATKGTAYLYGAGFAGVGLLAAARRHGTRAFLRLALSMALCMVLVNGAFWSRNMRVFHHPLGDPVLLRVVNNDAPGWRPFVSNTLRNAAIHVGGLSGAWASRAERATIAIHGWLGLDPHARATTFRTETFKLLSFVHHEDFQGNPLHAGLIGAALAAAAVAGFRRWRRGFVVLTPPTIYTLCKLTGLFLFLLLVKWQPWHSRLHTPLFVLGAVPVACALHRLRSRSAARWPAWLETTIALGLCAAVVPVVWKAEGRAWPGIFRETRGRETRYLDGLPADLREAYPRCLAEIRTVFPQRAVTGLVMNEESWEYPLWRLARQAGDGMTYAHAGVANPSGRLSGAPRLDALLLIQQPGEREPEHWGLTGWKLHRADGGVRLYFPASEPGR